MHWILVSADKTWFKKPTFIKWNKIWFEDRFQLSKMSFVDEFASWNLSDQTTDKMSDHELIQRLTLGIWYV